MLTGKGRPFARLALLLTVIGAAIVGAFLLMMTVLGPLMLGEVRSAGGVILAVFVALPATLVLYSEVKTRELRERLSSRGYTWITSGQVRMLKLGLGKAAWNIPPRDEMAILPGYEDENIPRLIEQFENIARERRIKPQ